MTYRVFMAMVAVLCICCFSPNAKGEDYSVYLIGGQSNANGRGDASELEQPLDSPQKNVRFFWHRSQGARNVGWLLEDQWTDLAPGSGHGSTSPVYPKEFGLEVSFGHALSLAHPNDEIAIIKYSHGGSNLHTQWAESGAMYKTFVSTIKNALEKLAAAGHTYRVQGMVWQQGEADAENIKYARQYHQNLTSLVARIRRDLDSSGNLPFVVGGLSHRQHPDVARPNTGFGTVRSAQELVAKSVPLVGFVNTDDFPTRIGEPIHFNHQGLISLGEAHAMEIIRLERECAQTSAAAKRRVEKNPNVK